MRCYFVLVHGKLKWLPDRSAKDDLGASKPAGFYAHRYVLAWDKEGAISTAVRRVRENLDKQLGWVRGGLAIVELSAEEVAAAPVIKLLTTDNRGHSFYSRE